MMKRLLLMMAVAAGAFLPGLGAANPWSFLGFDGKSIGVGGALSGGASGPQAVFHNPAGLLKLKQREAAVTYLHGEPLLKFDLQDNPDALDFSRFAAATTADCAGSLTCIDEVTHYNEYLRRARTVSGHIHDLYATAAERARETRRLDGVTMGMSVPLAINPQEAWAAAGVGLFLPIGPILYQRLKGPTTPYFLKYDDGPHRIVLDAVVAVEPFKGFRLGGGVDVLVDVSATPQATILFPSELRIGVPPDPNFQDIQLFVDGTVELPPVFAPVVGIQYSPAEWVDIGASFRDQQGANIKIGTSLFVQTPFGTRTIPAEVLAGGVFTPMQVAGGFAFHPLRGLHLYADATWQRWSTYLPPFAIEANVSGLGPAACDLIKSFSDLSTYLDLVQDSDIGSSAESLGFEIPTDAQQICDLVSDAVPQSINIKTYDTSDGRNVFKNTVAPAIGVAYGRDRWEASAGYRYEPSPVPYQDGIFNILDSETHVISGSFSYQVLSFASVGLFGQYRLLKTVDVSKSRDRVIDEIGADAFPDIEGALETEALADLQDHVSGTQVTLPGYPGYSVGGGYLTAGLQISLAF